MTRVVNVDLTKAKYDKATNTVKWTLDYVKSKIDIEKFKKAYKTEIIDKLGNMTEMSEEEKMSSENSTKKLMKIHLTKCELMTLWEDLAHHYLQCLTRL
ncbi:hypothetical protein [Mycoplasmopsis agalactiae]|uniref:hypothetical protein n=1 Tax=Mycoplasmopsis agalactiae TaxID=2110 RepID=UPI001F1D01D0|nr:hypothetical protein [Mycoplasmopsis agalactiae]